MLRAAVLLAGAALFLLLPVRTMTAARPRAGRPGDPAGRERTLRRIAVVGVGAACLALWGVPLGVLPAAAACPATAVALRHVHARTSAAGPDRSVALALDLAAAALRAGRPLPDALSLAAPAARAGPAADLERVAGLLRLGAEPAHAWQTLAADAALGTVAATAVRSASSGIKLAAGFERAATAIRAEVASSAAARAQRAGVLAMAPLGLCFLPSFVCLGVIPVVVGIARSALGDVLP